jgi:hypothetical protein
MSNLVIIRLHPEKPTDGSTFTSYLTDLRITVSDMSFANPQGTGNGIGSAFYDPTDPNGTIVQHEIFLPAPAFASVATAAILIDPAKLPPTYAEYQTSDLRLTITRGTQKIVDRSLNYNVDVDAGAAVPPGQDPILYAVLGPTSLYIALPDPGIGLDPTRASVDVPKDGSPPNFDDLLLAIQRVYAGDPTGVFDINSPPLTQPQARHIAYEILWNRQLNPLPVPPASLEELYTAGPALAPDANRQKFESDLLTYSTTTDTQAEVLAKYVFALSAALACERQSNTAARVGLTIPVLPGIAAVGGKAAQTDVILSG